MAANRFFRVTCDEKLGYVGDDFKAKQRECSPFSRSAAENTNTPSLSDSFFNIKA